MMTAYPYAKGDPLDRPNVYSYALYAGEAFLVAWRMSREAAARDLPAAADPPPAQAVEAAALGDQGGQTATLLEHAFEDVARDGESRILDRLIQRFEVTKRIHRSYGPNWRSQDPADYQDLGLYVRFAELVETAYSSTGELPPLNALLKCLDTLTASRGRLDRGQAGRLARLIQRERRHIERLERDLGS